MLGERMDIAQGALEGACEIIGRASGCHVRHVRRLGRTARGIRGGQDQAPPLLS